MLIITYRYVILPFSLNTLPDLLIEFAKIGIGAACVIKEFVAEELKEGLLEEIPLSVPIPKRSVGFAYSQSIYMTEAIKGFVAFYSEKETLTSSL